MKSPFQVFRRHQKVLMVVLVGLAMLAFVIGGTISDPQSVTGPMMVGLLALAIGSIMFLVGLGKKKSKEYGGYGMVIGACIGLILVWRFGPTPAISMTGGNVTAAELQEMQHRRELANRFMYEAVTQINERELQPVLSAPYFGPTTTEEMAYAETLRREADRLGIVTSQETVTEFLQTLTMHPITEKPLITGAIMREVCREIGASEQAVYDALEDEWRISQAYRMLTGSDPMTPDLLWDAHQQLKVQQDMEFAVIPLASFVDHSREPSGAELEEFFAQYRENVPNLTPDGELDEGRPGFLQPPRAQLAYIEGSPEDFLDQVEVTAEEIEEEYARRFPPLDLSGMDEFHPGESSVPAGDLSDPFLDGPLLPPTSIPDSDVDDATEPVTPDDSAPSDDAEAGDEATPDATEPPDADSESSAPSSESETPPQPETDSNTESEESDPDAEGDNPAPPVDNTDTEAADSGDDGSSCDDPVPDEAPAAESAEETAPSDDEATDEESQSPPTGEAETTDQPADEASVDEPPADAEAVDDTATPEDTAEDADPAVDVAETSDAATDDAVADDAAVLPPFTLSDSEDPPPPPLAEDAVAPFPPPLDDNLRSEIAEYLRRKKADELLAADLQAFAREFQRGDIPHRAGILPPSDEDHLTTAEALEATRRLASEGPDDDDAATYDYFLETTSLLSFDEFGDEVSPDLAAATLVEAGQMTGTPVRNALYAYADDRYNAVVCATPAPAPAPNVPGIPTRRFVIWKIAETSEYAPESIDDGREGLDPDLRQRVIQSWREFQARELVDARAEQLVEIAQGSDEPFTTVFDGVPLIEGKELTIRVSQTNPTISWYTTSSTAMGLFSPPPVMASLPNFPEIETGDRFFETVFRDMEVGEVRAVWNGDFSQLIIVRVNDRIPASREAFLTDVQNAFTEHERNQDLYAQLAQFMQGQPPPPPPALLQIASHTNTRQSGRYDIRSALFAKYDVQYAEEPVE